MLDVVSFFLVVTEDLENVVIIVVCDISHLLKVNVLIAEFLLDSHYMGLYPMLGPLSCVDVLNPVLSKMHSDYRVKGLLQRWYLLLVHLLCFKKLIMRHRLFLQFTTAIKPDLL